MVGEGAPCPRCLALAQLVARALASAPTCSRGAGVGQGWRVAAGGDCPPSPNAASPHAGDGRKVRAARCLAPGWDVQWVGREAATGCSVVWAGCTADTAVQSFSNAANSLKAFLTHPFLKVSPKDEKREQPGSSKPSRAQPVPCLLRRRLLLQYLAPLAASA